MIDQYLNSWNDFQTFCETKAKGRAIINSDGWQKLAAFHLETYLKKHKNPYLFLFTVKMERKDIFSVHKMDKWYRFYCRRRCNATDYLISQIENSLYGNFRYR